MPAVADPPAAETSPHGDGRNGPAARLVDDRSFWGVLTTQFLGSFNDNLFKQLVFLVALDYKLAGGKDYQGVGLALFALPFVLLSGTAGWYSDRRAKRPIVVACKALEIVVMALGAAAFFVAGGDLGWLVGLLLGVLALMSTQSAIFGPPKYGILPELFRPADLPRVNGLVQMTTFLSIIFGVALAGFLKTALDPGPGVAGVGNLWIVSAVCVGIAAVGTAAAFYIRRTPVAAPGLPFDYTSLAIPRSLWPLLKSDRRVPAVLFVSALFWLSGGLLQPAITALGKVQLGLGDTRPSVMAACVGFGIAGGCVAAAYLSKSRVRFGLVRIGAAGVAGVSAAVAACGWFDVAAGVYEVFLYPAMAVLGAFAGLFAVPLQVFLQDRPPKELKGRMIGAMNVCTWTGIVLSAGLYQVLVWTVADGPVDAPAPGAADPDAAYHWVFAAVAAVLAPVAVLFRPADAELS